MVRLATKFEKLVATESNPVASIGNPTGRNVEPCLQILFHYNCGVVFQIQLQL